MQRRDDSSIPTSSAADSSSTPIDSILIANRGEIALRVTRTASAHGIRTTAVYTEPDALSQHAQSTPFAYNLGDTSQYLNQAKIIDIAKQSKSRAIHPGYGFLSENAEFAKRCRAEGIIFIGPPPSAIEDMGDKARSKEIMEKAGVPCVPGYHGSDQNPKRLEEEAGGIGYPVLIKAVRGGGGKGMRIVKSQDEFQDMLDSAKSEARNSFGNDEVLVEKYITTPRHIEVQVFADKHGNCVALGERDCSIQRRHQKILEESPAPNLEESIRQDIWEKARAAALAVGYEGAGTVEFIFDNDTGEFFFMEMNTRLQVEHPVTEMVTGLDLVHWQIMVAEGKSLPLSQEQVHQQIKQRGHAIEARIYAENPDKGFIPDSGRLLHVKLPEASADVRIDTGFVQGDEISSNYDPMISKLIVHGEDRHAALRSLAAALERYEVAGPVTNIDFLQRCCRSQDFIDGQVETGYIEKHRDELFGGKSIGDEILAQAALASYLARMQNPTSSTGSIATSSWLSPTSDFALRTFNFSSADEQVEVASDPTVYSASVRQIGSGSFEITLPDSASFNVTATFDSDNNILSTFFPYTQLKSTIITDPISSTIHLFTRGQHTRLIPSTPPWVSKALGKVESKNSVRSPMPCKILRVDVQAGDIVKKDQLLLVVESMKMETTIRSPIEGVVKRIVHAQGEVVAAGVELVEFEAAEEESSEI